MPEIAWSGADDLRGNLVAVSRLKPYLTNPRRGDVEAIRASLEEFGQYRPIVVWKKNDHVLAGNHTFLAAKALGWNRIAVTVVDVDDQQARRIVLADNRTGDLGGWDERVLLEFTQNLSSLQGTGFDEVDLDRLITRDEFRDLFETKPDAIGGHRVLHTSERSSIINIGQLSYYLTARDFLAWWRTIKDTSKIPAMLKWPVASIEDADFASKPPEAPEIPEDEPPAVLAPVGHRVPLGELKRYQGSPRSHEVPVIMDSLRRNGQYRPITVNTRDDVMRVVVGLGVLEAARRLKWESLDCTFVDVDEDTARRMMLADNRTADLAHYDNRALGVLLEELDGDVLGSGFDALTARNALDEAGMLDHGTVEARPVTLRIRCDPEGVDVRWVSLIEPFVEWQQELTRAGRYSQYGMKLEICRRLKVRPEVMHETQPAAESAAMEEADA